MPTFNDPRQRSFVLIATYGRSGSTVLQALLGAQPGWCIRGENYHTLQGLFDSTNAARQTKAHFGRRQQPPDNPWFGADAVDPDAYGRALARNFVDHVLNPPPTAHVVGFKEVRLFHRISLAPELFDFVLGVFAPARIVFLQRAWHEISGSGWWPALDPDDVRSYVQRCDAVMDEYALRRPDRATVVRYTDLVHRRETVRELFDFLRAEYDPAQVDEVLAKRLTHGRTVRERALNGRADLTEIATLVEETRDHPRITKRWKNRLVRRLMVGPGG